MSPERTVEERFGVEKAIEWGIALERGQRGLNDTLSWEQKRDIQKARRLNPAYESDFSAEEVQQGAVGLRVRTAYANHSYQDRPVRDVSWLRFFPHFEDVHLNEVEVADYSPLASLPNLRKLAIYDDQTIDLRPVGRCTNLEHLAIRVRQPWVRVDGLEQLEKLETVEWLGSPLVLQGIPRWPAVRRAAFKEWCVHFPLRDALQLPEMPLLEELQLESIFSLEGFARYPRLVNLRVAGTYRDLSPLVVCRGLTHLSLELSIHLALDVLRDVSPLVALPELRYLHVRSQRPRDYSSLVEAPRLHQVEVMAPLQQPVTACAMELATLNATLEPWDAEFLAVTARPLSPLRVNFIDTKKKEEFPGIEPLPGPAPEWEKNRGFRESEGKWLARRLSRRFLELLDQDQHWGEVSGPHSLGHVTLPIGERTLSVEIKSQEAAERLREVIALLRSEFARLRCRWRVNLYVALELPPVNDPRAMAEIERRREQADDEYHALQQKESAEFLERQHRLELQKESGGKVRPGDFAAEDALPPEEEEDADDDDDDDEGGGGLAELSAAFEPDRPHPLADQYRIWGFVQENGACFYEHNRETVKWLLGPEPKS